MTYTDTASRLDTLDETTQEQGKILVGIGDLHGHLLALERLMEGLDEEYGIFEDRHLLRLNKGVEIVFTGDYIDRGNNALGVIDALRDLEEVNPTAVRRLFGNHELMALSCKPLAQTIACFPPEEEGQMFTAYAQGVHGRNGGVAFVKEFGVTPKEAFESYTRRIARNGDIGKWMRSLKPLHLARIGSKRVLFVHGGIPHQLDGCSLLENYLFDFDEHLRGGTTRTYGGAKRRYVEDEKVGRHSIFWDRRIPDMQKQELEQITKSLDVNHIVIGHTPQRVIQNYFGLAFNVDVGMSPVYGENEPAAVVFKERGVYAFYVEKGERRLVG